MIHYDIRGDADIIIRDTLCAADPKEAVENALRGFHTGGKLIIAAVGKAAYRMAEAAAHAIGKKPDAGIIITKYGHAGPPIDCFEIFEAGHPVSDSNSYKAADRLLKITSGLTAADHVLLLLSGGGSALFEFPAVPTDEYEALTERLMKKGADIIELNCVRKGLSNVKGGRFALHCAPAHISTLALCDVICGSPSTIASGPTCIDDSNSADAFSVLEKYDIVPSESIVSALIRPRVTLLENSDISVIGDVGLLCRAAAKSAEALGYSVQTVTESLEGRARDAGEMLARFAYANQNSNRSLAFIFGGETTVEVNGDGLGGRNQEIALSAARMLELCENTAVFSFGSDGTDGPTDAAGGYADETTFSKLISKGIDPYDYLDRNDSYHALGAIGSLIVTGPTGTNLNDVSIILIKRQ